MRLLAKNFELELVARLSELTAGPVKVSAWNWAGAKGLEKQVKSLFVRTQSHRFACLISASGGAGAVNRTLDAWLRSPGKDAPLMVVPYMGPGGKDLCVSAGISWLDLSGNAGIAVPGMLIRVEGRPHRFKPRGRPWSAFAAKSSRVTRFLLQDPLTYHAQRSLAAATGLSESFVSKIVRRLEEDALITRQPGTRGVRPRDPALLLQAWKENYDFLRHEIIRGHVPTTGGEALLRNLSATLAEGSIRHAATGLAAAWLLSPHATFRLTTVYVEREPDETVLEKLGFRETERGPNLWLVVPDDAGVFQGAADRDGVPCVHPVQAFLDLQAHPERSREAAEHLRESHLNWPKEPNR